MSYIDISHIAINVPNLREAEAYYCELFGLEVAWRDSEGRASLFASWEELDAAGAEPAVILVWREILRIAISRGCGTRDGEDCGLDHAGLQVSADELRTIRNRLQAQDVETKHARGNELLVFADRYGVEWELDTRSYADPREIGRQAEERQRRAREA